MHELPLVHHRPILNRPVIQSVPFCTLPRSHTVYVCGAGVEKVFARCCSKSLGEGISVQFFVCDVFVMVLVRD